MVFARSAARSLERPAASLLAGQATPHFARRAPQAFPGSTFAKRTLTATAARQGKVLLVLYDVGWSLSYPQTTAKQLLGPRARQRAAKASGHYRERARYQEMARGPGTYSGHDLRQGGRGL